MTLQVLFNVCYRIVAATSVKAPLLDDLQWKMADSIWFRGPRPDPEERLAAIKIEAEPLLILPYFKAP